MKGVTVLKWMVWGVTFWSFSLVWPEVNSTLTPPVITGLALILAATSGIYLWGYYQRRVDRGQRQPHKNRQKHASRPSRPVPPLSMA